MILHGAILVLASASLLTACGLQDTLEKSKPKKKGDDISLPKAPIIEDKGEVVSTKPAHTKIEPTIDLKNWHHKDLKQDALYGVGTDKTYAEFNLKQEKEIVVAVIDSGVDYNHEDLKEVMWVNKNEIPGNGIDDDNNGYVDDIYGWNYIGGKDGSHLNDESLEVTRLYKKLLAKVQAGDELSAEESNLFNETKKEVEGGLKRFGDMLGNAEKAKKKLAELTFKLVEAGIKGPKTREEIEAITSNDAEIIKVRDELLKLWDEYRGGFKGIDRIIDIAGYYVKSGYNTNWDARTQIVGDDPSDFSDTDYGNNDVKGPDSSHGTHVAGSIAATRGNNIGMDGIAGNVKIMALRAVPNGDERDKDIALAIRYAADNGAHIINMSFGKDYSPYKEEVDKAFQYAAKKGVLFLHAAGNSSKSVDGGTNNFPNSYLKQGSGVLAVNTIENWIEVGASTKDYGLNLPASFTNYGAKAVTLFSPGHKIYSTTPENEYAAYSGTSMATPVAAGVISALMSEFPTMTGPEARAIILATVSQELELAVRKPDESARTPDFRLPVPFKELSETGGVINLYKAMKLADELANSESF